MHQKSMNICVRGSANYVAVFNKENHEITCMFLVEIELAILVFWCPQTVHFVRPSGKKMGLVLVDLAYMEAI